MTPEMQIVAIMQETGWTYDEYMSNPNPILNLLKDKLDIDAEKSKQANKK